MFVTVRREDAQQSFNIWVYRDGGRLSRGSGLFVSQDGVVMDHHFLLAPDSAAFSFRPGDYTVEVFAKLVRSAGPLLLTSVSVQLSEQAFMEAEGTGGGTFFDWQPDLGRYSVHTRPVPIGEGGGWSQG